MKDLFLINNFQTPHLETDLELINKNYCLGNEIHVLSCKGHLKTCFANPNNTKIKCKLCISKVNFGLGLFENISIHSQKVIDFFMPDESEYNSIEKLKNLKYKNINIGLGIFSSLVTTLRDHKFDIIRNISLVNKSIYSSILNLENFIFVYLKIKPNCVYLFNGRFSEYYPIVQYCITNSIIFYTHERGSNNSKYILRKNSIPHSINYTIKEIEDMWNESLDNKISIGNSFFQERVNNIEQNWVSFTSLQIKGKLPNCFDPSIINVAIFNSSLDEYESIPDFSNPVYPDDNLGIDRICNSFLDNSRYFFYLRVHPNLKNLNNTQIIEIKNLSRKYSNLFVIMPEDTIDSYELIDKCDAVITFNSTVGVEALYFGTKSILAGRAFYENLDDIFVCHSHDMLLDQLHNINKGFKGKYFSHLKYGYWAKTYGVEYYLYKAKTLFSGRFMNIDLNLGTFEIILWRIINRIFY